MDQKRIGAVLAYSNIFLKNASLFIYTPLLLNYLGQTEYGIYQMVNSLISNLTIMNMGFSFAYIKFFTRQSLKKDSYKAVEKLNGLYLILFTFISLFTLLIGFLLILNRNQLFSSSLKDSEMNLVAQLMGILVVNIVLTFFSSIFDANILAHEEFRFQQTRQLGQTILFPLITIPTLIFFRTGAVSVVLIQTILSFILLMLNIKFCIKKLHMRFYFKQLDVSMLKEVTIFSFFIFLNQIFNQINDTAPTFIIGTMKGAKQVAIYSIVNQLKAVFFLLSQSLTNIFIPKVNRIVHQSDNSQELLQLMIKIGRIQALILGLFIGGFITVGKYFLTWWIGPNFEASYYLLVSIIIPLLIPLSQNLGLEIQQARNKHMFRSIVLTLFSILNILITVIMVSRFGVYGLTAGYIFSLIFGYGMIMNWYYHKKLKLNMITFWKNYFPYLTPCLVATISCTKLFDFPVENILAFVTMGSLYILIYAITALIVQPKIVKIILKRGRISG